MNPLKIIDIYSFLYNFYNSFPLLLFLLIISHSISQLTLQKTLKLRKKIRPLIKFRRHLINGANLSLNRPIDIREISLENSLNFFLTHYYPFIIVITVQ
jgi:hypothetical protein